MALRNLLVCIATAGGSSDLPCIILHSPGRDVSLSAARALVAALGPRGHGGPRAERRILSAVDPGRHSTHFDYERAASSLLVDLSQSEVARCAALDWITPIAPTRHILGVRRTIVLHCADLLSWAHQNALKKIIEASQCNTLFVLTTSQAAALQSAIISRGIVIRCPGHAGPFPPQVLEPCPPAPTHAPQAPKQSATSDPPEQANTPVRPTTPGSDKISPSDAIRAVLEKALAATSPSAASKACRDGASLVAKMMPEVSCKTLLVHVLDHLLVGQHDQVEVCHVIDSLCQVDVLVAAAKGPARRAVTLSSALHHALLLVCARRVKINTGPSK